MIKVTYKWKDTMYSILSFCQSVVWKTWFLVASMQDVAFNFHECSSSSFELNLHLEILFDVRVVLLLFTTKYELAPMYSVFHSSLTLNLLFSSHSLSALLYRETEREQLQHTSTYKDEVISYFSTLSRSSYRLKWTIRRSSHSVIQAQRWEII